MIFAQVKNVKNIFSTIFARHQSSGSFWGGSDPLTLEFPSFFLFPCFVSVFTILLAFFFVCVCVCVCCFCSLFLVFVFFFLFFLAFCFFPCFFFSVFLRFPLHCFFLCVCVLFLLSLSLSISLPGILRVWQRGQSLLPCFSAKKTRIGGSESERAEIARLPPQARNRCDLQHLLKKETLRFQGLNFHR